VKNIKFCFDEHQKRVIKNCSALKIVCHSSVKPDSTHDFISVFVVIS